MHVYGRRIKWEQGECCNKLLMTGVGIVCKQGKEKCRMCAASTDKKYFYAEKDIVMASFIKVHLGRILVSGKVLKP